ncbi:MAG: guanylate kinase [Janthinobacterium lividum]
MNLRSKGLVLILSSPSGGGKSSILRAILAADRNLKPSISVTTRKPRISEQENIDYFFKSEQEFTQLISNNMLLEYATIYNNYYGTPGEYIKNTLNQGIDIIVDIDWQGTKQIKEKIPHEVVTIFILPPTIEVLKNRLIARAEDSNDIIHNRIQEALDEISNAKYYDYVVINDDFALAVTQVRSILEAERCKVSRLNNL